jgi:hypothetical protein
MKNTESNNRADKIMESLNGLQKAVAPDFFYTRLTGKMQAGSIPEKKTIFLLRPAFAATMLAIVFIINIISITQLNKKQHQANKPVTIESFTEAYGMNTVTVY